MWQFGDGRTSTASSPLLVYSQKGNYKLTLTAYGKDGKKSITGKTIIVKERQLKSFTIQNLDINSFAPSQNGLPVFSSLDLWMEIKLISTSFTYTSNNDIIGTTVYKSPVFNNIDSSFHKNISFTIPSTDKILIDYPVLNNTYYINNNGSLIINLYGKNSSGTYLLSSSKWNGAGIYLNNGGNPSQVKNYELTTYVVGSNMAVTLNVDYN